MRLPAFDELLTVLEKTANANPMLLDFAIPIDTDDVGEILLRHLQAGTFDTAMRVQDLERGYGDYHHFVLSPVVGMVAVPKAGKLYNGKARLDCQAITQATLQAHLLDMMCGGEIYRRSVNPVDKVLAEKLILDCLAVFDEQSQNWQAHLIKPDFLHHVNECADLGWVNLGFFEGFGRDMAIAIKTDDVIYVLLVNGYAP